jgi:hypothetical protein
VFYKVGTEMLNFISLKARLQRNAFSVRCSQCWLEAGLNFAPERL